MKFISSLVIPQLDNKTPPSSDIIYWINYLLYNELKINGWNISADINIGSDYKCVFPLSKMGNMEWNHIFIM